MNGRPTLTVPVTSEEAMHVLEPLRPVLELPFGSAASGLDTRRLLCIWLVVAVHGLFMWFAARGTEPVPEEAAPIVATWEEPAPEAAPEPPVPEPESSPIPLPVASPVPTAAPEPEPPVVAAASAQAPAPGEATVPVQADPQPAAGSPASGPGPSTAGGDPPGSGAGEGEATAQEADYLANPAPDYPLASRLLGEEGRVQVRALVDAQGLPLEVALGKSCGHERLDRSALATVRRWKFRPAQAGGAARAGWVVIPIRFSLRRS